MFLAVDKNDHFKESRRRLHLLIQKNSKKLVSKLISFLEHFVLNDKLARLMHTNLTIICTILARCAHWIITNFCLCSLIRLIR